MPDQDQTSAKPNALRVLGRFELRQLLGKSDRTMVWLAFDPRSQQELILTLPRVQPVNAEALEHWLTDARQAARLNHPRIAHVVDVDVEEHWPYIAVDRALGITLGERLQAQPQLSIDEAADWLTQILEGLAFAHEAGLAHGDVQLHQVLVSDQGNVRVMALGASLGTLPDAAVVQGHERAMPMDPSHLREKRAHGVRDVLATGVLMHRLLSGVPVLDQADISRVVHRLPPEGRDLVRLPWSTPVPVPEALRAIANRATASQERQRYHNARTLLAAINGWREVAAQDSGGALALLIGRLRSVGHLPAGPGVGARVARIAVSESQRTDEMAAQILQDIGLSFELLRTVNSAQVQGTQASGNGPVLTIRRAMALVGLKGVRQAAASLRAWPGAIGEAHVPAMQRAVDHVRLAGHVAQALRPAGYDPEVIYVIAALQNLGRLLVQYHFAEEAEQIRQLMQNLPADTPGGADLPGMTEEAASYAVLGVDIESLGAAVAKYWGLNDEVMQMARRLPLGKPVRTADTDNELLRQAASAANEAVDALTQLPSAQVGAALQQVAQRYARALAITVKDVSEAVQAARGSLHGTTGEAPRAARRQDPAQGASQVDAGLEDDAQAASAHADEPVTGFAALLASRQR